MWAVGLIVGGFAGAVLGNFATAIAGAVLGALAGLILGALNAQTRKSVVDRLSTLESRVEALDRQFARLAEPGAPAGEARPPGSAVPAAASSPESPPIPPPLPQPTLVEPVAAVAVTPRPVRLGGSGDPRLAAAAPATAGSTVRVPPPPWLAWLMGVNTLARIGMLLLLIGVGFLAKYAVEHVRVPIEIRLSGIALGGIALLVVGWRLRVRRTAYAMLLQGGGVGVLYLTVFAAFRLYGLLSPAATIVLLLLIAALSSGLAILQDAVVLAVIAVVGGFLAPILTATSTGNHVFLFSYYALLNAAILGIAWFKAWRILNLLGFVFTFVIGAIWGAQNYRPELFATTEPFLILFFLFYVGVATLYALRRSVELARYVDGTIVFGTPLVAAALQSALVRDTPFGMALSALAAAALYLGLAWILYARRAATLQLLVESFLALGVIFATLAIPLALDARWTSATWALEGAAILWAGVRQQRLPARVFGLLLQLGAGIAYGGKLAPWAASAPLTALPVLNSEFVGAALLALSGLYSAWLLWRSRSIVTEGERAAALLLFAWGNAWWLFAGWREIESWVPFELRLAAFVGFITASAGAFAIAESRLEWPIARVPALALLPGLLLLAAGGALWRWDSVDHLFGGGGYVAWPIAFAVVVALLDRFDRTPPVAGAIAAPLAWWHAATLWLAVLVVAQELSWLGRQIGSGDGVWMTVPWGLIPALALLAVSHASASGAWPMQPHRRAYSVFGAVPLLVLLVLWTLDANTRGDGDPLPLPYLPLFNPLDLTQGLALIAGATWLARLKRDDDPLARSLRPAAVATTFVVLGFFWVNAVVLRTIHFWFEIPYTLHALWRSTLVQATFSLLWTLLALGAMLFANRGRSRPAWVAGAVLLALVVIKLFLVDLGQAGTVERIVSFIGVGLLLLLIGYLAPVPPRRPEEAQ